jgi:hypothetical protein
MRHEGDNLPSFDSCAEAWLSEDSSPPRQSDVFGKACPPPAPTPDVFAAFGRRASLPSRDPEAPLGPRERAAAEFDRGWAALREGRPEEALSAWEAALALDPTNRTYAIDVRHLRQRLGQGRGLRDHTR